MTGVMMSRKIESGLKDYIEVLAGNFIFAAGINLFITPAKLFSGGIIGFAQIIRSLLVQGNVPIPPGMDIAGIINFCLNVPLFLMAYRDISRQFFYRTLAGLAAQTVFITLLKVPLRPILEDELAASIIGGFICGVGIGIALRSHGSGGGIDILCVFFTKKFRSMSVGKVNIIINATVFLLSGLLFSVPTAIYSIINTVCMALIIDRVYSQNINVAALIFTKCGRIQDEVLSQMGRGVTYWDGAGAYTKTGTRIMMTIISKYEVQQLKTIIHKFDPKAFSIFIEGISVSGNFQKRL